MSAITPPRRSLSRYVVVAVLAVALGGCASGTSTGSGSGSGSGETAATGDSTGQAITPAQDYTTLDPALVEAAEAEGGSLVWYESSPEDQAGQILDAFREEFPFVTEAQHVQLRASDVASRVVQESQADAATADVVTSDAASLSELGGRELLTSADWEAAGVPPELAPNDRLVASAAAVFVLIYNSDQVEESDAPAGWDDLLDPKWAGKVGTWESPYAFAELVPTWGGEKTMDYAEKFAAQQPTKYQSTFPLAQAVGAGEIETGVGIYHSTQPAIADGAPIGVVVPEPVPVTLLYSAIPEAAQSPATAKLFATWLTTESGATAYEDATSRGNPLLPGTDAAKLVEGRTISDFSPEKAGELADWLTKLSR